MRKVTLKAFFQALSEVESGGPVAGKGVYGDGGKAFGPLQIHMIYFKDAMEYLMTPYAFRALAEMDYRAATRRFFSSCIVFCCYMMRHAKEDFLSLTMSFDRAEKLARIHNGGPNGASKEATKIYWERVRNQIIANAEKGKKNEATTA
jgi:hypothetical protein